jgi:hypothetical protein
MGKRHRRIRARSATGQVAGAATEKPGLDRPSSNTRPAQHASPRKPLSRSPDPNPGPSQNNSPRAPFSCPEYEQRPARDAARKCPLLLDKRASPPAGSSRPLGTSCERPSARDRPPHRSCIRGEAATPPLLSPHAREQRPARRTPSSGSARFSRPGAEPAEFASLPRAATHDAPSPTRRFAPPAPRLRNRPRTIRAQPIRMIV